MVTSGETGCAGGSQVATVAAAMMRHLLPAAPSLRLEVTRDDCGIWLHLTYPAPRSGRAAAPWGPAGELSLINSAAQRWGHYGDTHWHTLWALLPPQAGSAAADPTGSDGG